MAILLQHLSLKLGIVTGRDLAEVIGSAIALNLLLKVPLIVGILITACDVMIVLLLQNKGFRILECLVASLIVVIGGCFGYELAVSHPALRY